MPDPTDLGGWGTPPYIAAGDPSQQAANAPYSYPPAVMPYSLGGSPDLYSDPTFRRQSAFDALTGAGLGLLQASSPSPYPTNFGTMFGGLAGGAAQGMQQGRQRHLQEQMAYGQIQNMRIQQQVMQQLPQILGQGQGAQPQDATNPGAPPPQTAGGVNPNNIGNVRPVGASAGFQQPATFDDGTNLAVTNARAYPAAYNEGKPMTLEQIGAKWAPTGDGKNDPKAWAANVAKFGGLPVDQPINLDDPATAVKFARGVHGAEWGEGALKPAEHYQPGVDAALSGKKPGVQTAQAGGGAPAADAPFPGVPPQMTPQQKMGLMNPMTRPLVQAQIAEQQKQYEAKKAAWEANLKLRATRREEANAEVIVGADGVARPNPARIEADTQKKVGEAKATEVARKEAIFGGANWEKFSPEELRKKANPEALALVEQVQSGQTKIGDISARAGSGGISVGKNDVMALGKKLYGEEWDPNAGERRQKFENDTTDTSSQTGKTLYSINTVYKHLNRYQELTDAINNHQTPLVNELLRHYNNAAGYAKYSSAEALQHSLGTEMAAVIKGQQLNLPEVEDAIDTIKTTKSPEQMHGALAVLRHAMGDRESTITHAARRSKVPESRIRELIDPDARTAIGNFDQKQIEFQKQQEAARTQQPGAPMASGQPVPSAFREGMTATNPQTGARLMFRGGQWVPQ